MPTQVTNYKCPSCGGPLHYEEASGQLACTFCGSRFSVAEVEAQNAKEDKKAQQAFEQEQEKQEESDWDMSGMSEDWGRDANGMRVYQCPSCGAELIADEATAAASCPYCDNPTIVPGQLGGTLKPDFIIPFKLDKESAKRALKNHYRRKLFLPGTFSSANHLDEIKGIYVPFWLFDAEAHANCTFHGTRSFTVRKGGYHVTTVSHYDIRRVGTVTFERIPTDASLKMSDDYMDSIEPFDYTGLKPFSTAYLPGFLADKYDLTAQHCAARADTRSSNTAIAQMRKDVRGYEAVTPVNCNVRLSRGKVQYALMPVWTLRTKWENKEYLFMMNGQTGKMVGNLPVSKYKFWALFGALSVLLSGLILYLGIGQTIAEIFLS